MAHARVQRPAEVCLDYRVVAVGYVVMRVSMVAMWARVARQDPVNRRTALLYIVFTAAAQLGWVTVAILRHMALFGAVAAVGAGLHVAAYAVEGEAAIGTLGVVMAVAIPVLAFCVVYFTLYSVLFRAVDTFHLRLAAGMVAFLVAGVLLATAGVPLGWCLLVVTASPFVVVVVGYETVGYRHVSADLAREG